MSAIKHHHHHTIEAAQRPKQRPILFTTDMVRAILEGRKTQTRRIIKHPPPAAARIWHDGGEWNVENAKGDMWLVRLTCPYGSPGDRLWVRETWAMAPAPPSQDFGYIYKADFNNDPFKWRPSIHMPRAAARITLLITDIRAERLHDITEADARAEGVEQGNDWFVDYAHHDKTYAAISARHSYFTLWEKINGPGSWEQTPWVWVISFKKV